ncbi:hypothetical protein ZWY2020_044163 [Hordeum vulgare]|nr:hypothetical protein ZWY2020_044163 [Hordeum vulgare]
MSIASRGALLAGSFPVVSVTASPKPGCCRMRADGRRGRTALHLAPPSSIASQVTGNYGLEVAASLPCSCIAGWMDRLLTARSNGLMLTSRFIAHASAASTTTAFSSSVAGKGVAPHTSTRPSEASSILPCETAAGFSSSNTAVAVSIAEKRVAPHLTTRPDKVSSILPREHDDRLLILRRRCRICVEGRTQFVKELFLQKK